VVIGYLYVSRAFLGDMWYWSKKEGMGRGGRKVHMSAEDEPPYLHQDGSENGRYEQAQ
jgi:hypothetical protein